MSLLDVIRGIPERMGRGMERNIGGLLGIDPEDMTEEERRQARRLSQMAVFDAMARGTSPIAGLRQAAELLGTQRSERAQRREAEQRMGAAQQASSQIAGRLLGGAPIPTAPGPAAGDELTGVNIESQYRRDPMDALRIGMSQAGADAMQINPFLQAPLQSMLSPTSQPRYQLQNVEGVGLVAVDPSNPSDVQIVQPSRRAPEKPPGGDETYEGLRKEWNNITKDYRSISSMWAKVRQAGANPSPANDIALIFGYMKILDPQSVVREGEFATAENSGNIPSNILATYNRLVEGKGRLSDEQRQNFVNSAYGAVKSQVPSFEALKQDYTAIAEASRLDPRRAIIDPFKNVLLPKITDDVDGRNAFEKLPVGAFFEAPDGSVRRKERKQ